MEKARIYYINRKIVFPSCTMNVALPLTEGSRNLQSGNKIIAYPIRNIFDIYFYKNKTAAFSEITSCSILENTVRIKIRGLHRIRLLKIHNYINADYEIINEVKHGSDDSKAENLRKKAQELIFLINVEESDKLIELLNYLTDTGQLTDFISNYFVVNFRTRYRLFRESDIDKREKILDQILNKLIKNMNTGKKGLI